MAKKLVILIIFSLINSFTLQAYSQTCLGEAQFIAKVESVQKLNENSCLVKLADISQYRPSMVCPLSYSLAQTAGVLVGMSSQQACLYQVGQEISGILVLNADGSLILD